jgi:hypothetical protein
MPEKHPIHAKYPELHKSLAVEGAAKDLRSEGHRIHDDPSHKIEAWMSQLEGFLDQIKSSEQSYQGFKALMHRSYITGTDDASVERYLRRQAQIAQNQGHGMAEEIMQRATESVRAEARTTIRGDQERSLDAWLDYLSSEDATYPMWFKYYVFRNITKLAEFDKQKGEFPKRSKSTTAPFPDINREALAYMEDSLAKHYGLKHLDPNNPEEQLDPQMKELLDKDANFATLYKRAIDYAAPKTIENLDVTDGVWVKYDQTNDPEEAKKLAHSLHGYGTGWCTAGEGTAQSQLAGGDFYVYYTKSEDGQYSVPRVAIRMQGSGIAEVRGIEADQNLEGALVSIAELKMNEVDPQGAEGYKKKAEDMRRLTDIYDRHQAGGELSKDDLRFLYEIDSKIEGFGYEKDPRIGTILADRDARTEISMLLGVTPDKISLTKDEALSGGIVYHYGSLYLENFTSAEGLSLPQRIGGNLELHSLTSAEGLTLPHSIGGYLDLHSLTAAEGLTLPQNIGGSLWLDSLTSAEGLTLPQSIGGDLNLESLTSAEGLTLPQNIGGSLDLRRLTSAEGLTFPQRIGGDLELSSLTFAKDLTLRTSIGYLLNLRSLTNAENLVMPIKVGGVLIEELRYAKNVVFPQKLDHILKLDKLVGAKDVVLPEEVPGLFLGQLKSAAGIKLPHVIKHHLGLGSLITAEGLVLPQKVGGGLNLRSLTEANGLKLPDYIGRDDMGYDYFMLDLSSLKTADGLVFPEEVDTDIELYGLETTKGLVLPKKVEGCLNITINNGEVVVLPEELEALIIHELSNSEGLILPKTLIDVEYGWGVPSGIGLYDMEESEIDKLRKLRPDLADKIGNEDIFE